MKIGRSLLAAVGLLVAVQVAVKADDWTFVQLALVPPTLQLADENVDIKGFRLNLFYGRNKDVSGLDIGLIHETTGEFKGIGMGLVNWTDDESGGLQFAGIFNQSRKHFGGLQLGVVNHAGDAAGLQIGVVNIAENMNGIQIGLWNQINAKESWYIIPIVNWKF